MFKVLIFILMSCFTKFILADETIIIGANPIPHAQILKFIQPALKKQGITLVIKEFDGYRELNTGLIQKSLDANYFQSTAYLQQYNIETGSNLVKLVAIHNEPIGLYASNSIKIKEFKKTKNLAKLPKNCIIAIGTDVVNQNRALKLLEANRMIKLKSKSKISYFSIKDITQNPYGLIFKELDAAIMPRIINTGDIDLAIINSNYVLLSNLNPTKDAIFIEIPQKENDNLVVVRADEIQLPKIKKLALALQDKSVKMYIKKQFNGAVIPSF